MSTHNICFHGAIRKILCILSVAMLGVNSVTSYLLNNHVSWCIWNLGSHMNDITEMNQMSMCIKQKEKSLIDS